MPATDAFRFALALLCLASACGGTAVEPGSPDSGPPALGPCSTTGDCPSGATCFYPLGSCSAKGQCFAPEDSGTPACKLIEVVCGCGKQETTGCGFPNGFASGPAIGGCAEDAGPPRPEAGTPRGPCGSKGECPSGASCYFPIGSCSATGECVEDPPPGSPPCGAVEFLCGCGTPQTSGCGFPNGYASGPTTGTSLCSADGGAGG